MTRQRVGGRGRRERSLTGGVRLLQLCRQPLLPLPEMLISGHVSLRTPACRCESDASTQRTRTHAHTHMHASKRVYLAFIHIYQECTGGNGAGGGFFEMRRKSVEVFPQLSNLQIRPLRRVRAICSLGVHRIRSQRRATHFLTLLSLSRFSGLILSLSHSLPCSQSRSLCLDIWRSGEDAQIYREQEESFKIRQRELAFITATTASLQQ